jgi:UTP:GlnB (protein PII) uridylyltransferase
LGHDLYAALLLVILASTVVTPSLLRWRLLHLRAVHAAAGAEVARPQGGWLRVDRDTVDVVGQAPSRLALHIGLQAATALATRAPSASLLDWFGALDPDEPLLWDSEATQLLSRALLGGNERSWRFLETTGVLAQALPELAETVRKRRADPFLLDPGQPLRFALVDRIRELTAEDPAVREHWEALDHPEWLLLAALVIDVVDDHTRVVFARRLVKRLDLGATAEEEIALLAGDSTVLLGAAEHIGPVDEETVLQLATRLQTVERARALAVLSAALDSATRIERERLDSLVDSILSTIADPSLTGREATNTVQARRLKAIAEVGEHTAAAERIRHAPRAYVLNEQPADIARHAQLFDPLPRPRRPRLRTRPLSDGRLEIEVAARDEVGLVAGITGVLTQVGLDVDRAVVTTWPDGAALEDIVTRARPEVRPEGTDPAALEQAFADIYRRPLQSAPEQDARVNFDDSASPWYTVCEVRGPDHPGLLHNIAVAFAAAGVSIHSAEVRTESAEAIDRFELTDVHGRKTSDLMKRSIEGALTRGAQLDAHVRPQHKGWLAVRRAVHP